MLHHDESDSEHKGRADNVDRLVGRRLKMRRLMLGLSQQDIGKAVDVSIQQIQKYEKATNRISSGKLFAFSKFLRVPMNYFYTDEDSNQQSVGSAFAEENNEYDCTDLTAVTDKELISLIKAFNSIKNPQTRKKVIELIDILRK